MLLGSNYSKTIEFIKTNTRPEGRALYEVLFESEPKDLTLTELSRVQNEDGAWHPLLSWYHYPDDYKMAKMEWQEKLTINRLEIIWNFKKEPNHETK